VELHKPVSREDLERLLKGVDLEDGKTKVDKAEYVEDKSSREIGVELHSGKNRIVRRLFEALGYNVVKLDRVQFAGLTKKDLPRGMFRHLTEQEVAFLKMTK
jgi:23S rRNA pseudouridine2605 synthase